MDRTGKEHDKIFYVPQLPESAPSSRNLSAAVSGWSDPSGTRAMSSGELPLYAWSERRAAAPRTDDRVENAKRRLTRFISRIREANGLDPTDLRALLARYVTGKSGCQPAAADIDAMLTA